MSELDNWSEHLPDRRVIKEFLEWCSCRRIELCEWQDGRRSPVPCSRDERLLDEYHDVDQAALDRERRELIEEHRKRSERSFMVEEK